MAETLLTSQQEAAVAERKASVVLSSGAGCGKTTVLTERYLSHLERDGAAVSDLVAMTFTDKAARSMRQRIRTAIEKKIAITTGDERERWRTHLRGLETAQITTIHAFCGNLLRRHALAAGLDPNLEILDSAIVGNLMSKAVSDRLNALVIEPGEVGDALRELVRIFGWSQTRRGIDGLIQHADVEKWRAWQALSPRKIAAQWLGYFQDEYVPSLIVSLTGPASTLAGVLQIFRDTPCSGPKMQARIADILDHAAELATGKNAASVAARLREAAKVQGTEMGKAWPDKAVYETIQSRLTELRKELDTFVKCVAQQENLELAAAVGKHFIAAALACKEAFDREKRQAVGIDFDDMLIRARDLLRDDKDVLATVRRSVKFMLVDELQDTDPVQMKLVELICGKELQSGKLFAVGDAKQSIYRFRGADVGLFDKLRGNVPAAGQLSLTKNYRSQRAILTFVNALFDGEMPNYEPLENGKPEVGNQPCVEFLWCDTGRNAEDSRRCEARRIARRIVEMISGREKLVAVRPKNEPAYLREVTPGDVVLLFRAMTNVRLYEEAFRDAGIDYYLVGGKAFFVQQELFDVLNLLRVLENPHDLLSLAGVLRSPFGCLSDEALFMLGTHAGGLWVGLHDAGVRTKLPRADRDTAERVCRWLDEWRGVKDRLSIPVLLQRIIGDSGYDAALQFERLGERKLANLWKLFEIARTFDRPGGFGLADFIRELNRLTEVVPHEAEAATQPEESNVVRIMSIHQAKGLEFPVVFLPDFASRRGGGFYPVAQWNDDLGCLVRPPDEGDDTPMFSKFPVSLWQSREDAHERAEESRTMYVGCTRAADYLVISGSLDTPPKLQNVMIQLLAERFVLATGECRVASSETPRVIVAPTVPDTPTKFDKIGRPGNEPLTRIDARGVLPIEPDTTTGMEPAGEERDTAIRAVLAQWDMRDADGWREPLAAMEGNLFGWAKFAKSELRRQIAAAEESWRVVDFAAATPNRPVERGVIDLLWRDKAGWHVAGIAASGDAGDDGWFGRQDELKRQAKAVKQRVVDVQLYVWSSGDLLKAGD